MADKQPLNATFFAFKKRDRGGVLFSTTAAYILILIVVFGGFVVLNLAAVIDYFNWITDVQNAGGDASSMMTPPASVVALGPMYFIFQIVFYIIVAAYEAACLRWMIHGERGGLFGLSLGADTWRVYFTYWIWFFLYVAYAIILLVVLGGFGASLGFSAAQGGDPSQMGSSFLVMALIFCAWLVGMIFFSVRFAPAAATSVARRKFAFFDAWTVTKGRFWAIFGAFVLLILMYIVGYFIFSMIATFAVIGGMMGQMQSMGTEPTPDEMYALFANPAVAIPLAIICLIGLVGTLAWTIALYGVNARAAQAALEEGKIQAGA